MRAGRPLTGPLKLCHDPAVWTVMVPSYLKDSPLLSWNGKPRRRNGHLLRSLKALLELRTQAGSFQGAAPWAPESKCIRSACGLLIPPLRRLCVGVLRRLSHSPLKRSRRINDGIAAGTGIADGMVPSQGTGGVSRVSSVKSLARKIFAARTKKS